MKTLVITDVQRDFFDPSGSLYVAGGEMLPEKIMGIADNYDALIFTLDWHPGNHCSFAPQGGPWPVHCVAYTQGAGLADCFAPLLTQSRTHFYFKACGQDQEQYGAFEGLREDPKYAPILDVLQRSDEVHICGIAGDYCVKETADRLLRYISPSRLKVLVDYICSIDDGSALRQFVTERRVGVVL